MLSERKAYIMGYAWGILDKALGQDYDRSGSKFSQGAMRPWPAFTEAHNEAMRRGKVTKAMSEMLMEIMCECDDFDPSDQDVLNLERQAQWQLGVYHARAGRPITPKWNIADARKEKGMTQAQLAEAVGVDQAVISKWESGKVKPNEESMRKLKEALT